MPFNGLVLDTATYTVQGTTYEAPRRYTILEPVGQGAYGVVCSARDEEKRETVAIKKIEKAFEHLTFAKRTLREIRILRHLRHENLVELRQIFVPGPKDIFEDIYVVSELMETDLALILKSPQPLSNDHLQFFLYQILRGLKYVHSADVVHRDLKPRNLLVNSNCDLKICDYGLARLTFPPDDDVACEMTEYVCTRWYRAPEVLCSWRHYSKSIDIWSVGCIFGEMLRRKPIFPGKNTQHQLQMIVERLGTPDPETIRRTPKESCRRFIESLPESAGIPLEELLQGSSGAPPNALDLLDQMLRFCPTRRGTVESVLEHAYLAPLHCPEDEPSRAPLDAADFEFERRKIDMAALREEILREALRYYPAQLEQYMEESRQLVDGYDIRNYRLLCPGESQYTSDEEVSG